MTGPNPQLSVSAGAIRRYARLTGDMNPIHLDADFARTTPMGGIIAHGTLSAALIWQAARLNAATSLTRAEDFTGARLSVRFRRPVRIGDTVRGEVTAAAAEAETGARYAVRVVRHDGDAVIEGTLTLPGRPGRTHPET